jgi:outer membrane protein assembly factor BamD (BamD/ComL family)
MHSRRVVLTEIVYFGEQRFPCPSLLRSATDKYKPSTTKHSRFPPREFSHFESGSRMTASQTFVCDLPSPSAFKKFRRAFSLCALALAFALPGCHMGNLKMPFAKRDTDSDRETIDDVSGPLQRMMMSRRGRDPNAPLIGNDKADQEQLTAAQRSYDAKDYEVASKSLTGIVKRRNPRKFKLFQSSQSKRTTYDPIREEAAFYLAESEYQQQNYAAAQKHYTMLIKDYPSTRYMDESTGRLFKIAKQWLPVDEFASTSEIQQAAFDDRRETPLSSIKAEKKRFSWLPNLTDNTRPTIDTTGHALAALKTIWLNDPSGPLADDALMLTATFHIRSENYREADRMLTILREEFPKSTHLQTAFVLGSHVKLMSYQGAKYEERQLEDARQLKESTLRLFNGLPESDRIRGELKKIHNARAQRDWELALFWEKKNKPLSVAVYCREVIRNFPETQYATLARKKLGELNLVEAPDVNLPAGSVQLDPTYDQFKSEPAAPAAIEDDGPVFETTEPIFDEPATGRASFGRPSSPNSRATIGTLNPPDNIGRARLE